MNTYASTLRSITLGAALATCAITTMATAGTADLGPTIVLQDGDRANTTMRIDFPTPQFSVVKIGDMDFQQPVLDGESPTQLHPGAPNLPDVARSLRIPNTKRMGVFVTDAQWYDMPDMLVPPARGHFDRKTDMSQVPWEFSDTYQKDAFWPEQIAQLSDPWIMRDQRGIDLKVTPFQYNPVNKIPISKLTARTQCPRASMASGPLGGNVAWVFQSDHS